jgi:hypothetical protein
LIFLIVSLAVSMRAAILFCLPIILASNSYLLWRGRSSRLSWVVAASSDRLFVRMSAQLAKVRNNVEEPDVIVLGGSEIASISGRTVEVFFYGPKPKVVEQLVIEPGPEVAQGLTNRIRPLAEPVDLLTQVYVACEEGRLIMNWKRCRPDLRTFLQQVAQACPSVVIAPEERSELDLNVIWNGLREKPNAEQRKMLVQAVHLGFGRKCAELLSLHRDMSYREAGAYLAEIEREESGAENCSVCRF